MQQSTKQRVVGILVILVAAVVLLPAIFDGQGSYQLPLESRIPEPAPFPAPPIVTAERPDILADSDAIRVDTAIDLDTSADEEVAEPEVTVTEQSPIDSAVPVVADTPSAAAEPEPVVTVAETPGLDSTGLPQGWSVRLGSFSSLPNALNLVDRLQERGHKAYTREVAAAQGTLTAVFVGPGADREAMQQLQVQLQSEFQLSGMIVPYEINGL